MLQRSPLRTTVSPFHLCTSFFNTYKNKVYSSPPLFHTFSPYSHINSSSFPTSSPKLSSTLFNSRYFNRTRVGNIGFLKYRVWLNKNVVKYMRFPCSYISSSSILSSSRKLSIAHLKSRHVNHTRVGNIGFLKYRVLLNKNVVKYRHFPCSYISSSSISSSSRKSSIGQLKSSHVDHTHLGKIVFLKCRDLLNKKVVKYGHFPCSYISSSSISSSSRESSIAQLKSRHVNHTHLGKIVFSECENLLNKKVINFSFSSVTVEELVLRVSYVCPETARKFLSVSNWNPENVCDLLVGIGLGCRKSGFDDGIVECLWGIFNRVCENNEGFKHLPKSVEVMACMLINVGMFSEVELLVNNAERRGILLHSKEILSGLIEGYTNAGELERALLMYDKTKGRCLILSFSCYQSIIDVLTKERKIEYLIRVYEDMVDARFEFGDNDTKNLESLIGFLCSDGKIMEVRKFLRKIVSTQWKPSNLILSEVANAYCNKRDFNDLLNFFSEMKCVPDILVGNYITYFLCSHFGVTRADSFLWELEKLGFSPNEMTFGILISFCCGEGKLKEAFRYLSDIFSKGWKPDKHSYNSLISSMFKADMKEHVRDILNDMIDNGIKPDFSTYKTLLAGFCNAREFDEVKLLIKDMTKYGLVNCTTLEDPISKAFSILGLDPLTIKVKRDNDLKNFRTEFFDELGNGLYLDTNMELFEKIVNGILDESLVPEFNLLVSSLFDYPNVKKALLKMDKISLREEKLSPIVLSELDRLFYYSTWYIKTIPEQLINKSVQEALNLLIRVLSKNGFSKKCMLLFAEMHRRNIPIKTVTFNSMIIGVCKVGKIRDVLYYLNLLEKEPCLLEWKTFVNILDCLCHGRRVKEILELFDMMMVSYPDSTTHICDVFLQKLYSAGFSRIGDILMNELQKHSLISDSRMFQNFEILDASFQNNQIRKFAQSSRLETAVNLLDQLLKTRNIPDSSSYDCIIQSFSEQNNLNRAMEFYTEMLHRNLKPSLETYSLLVYKFCTQGDSESAEGVLNSMVGFGQIPTKKMYSVIIDRYRVENKLSKASELLQRMQKHGYEPEFGIQWSIISGLSVCDSRRGSQQGFLSRLLSGSGFFAESWTKSNQR